MSDEKLTINEAYHSKVLELCIHKWSMGWTMDACSGEREWECTHCDDTIMSLKEPPSTPDYLNDGMEALRLIIKYKIPIKLGGKFPYEKGVKNIFLYPPEGAEGGCMMVETERELIQAIYIQVLVKEGINLADLRI